VLILLALIFVLVADNFILPRYVEEVEATIPNLVGMHKDQAVKILKELNLNPIEEGPRFDEKYEKDHVIYHNPAPGRKVKKNRRVYLFVSGGEPLIKMPSLLGKTLRDAEITIERLGLVTGEVVEARSEFPANTVIGQEIEEGVTLPKGDTISLKISVGPKVGMVRVPNILGKSLKDAERILRRNSLRLGKQLYISTPNLLPNTVIEQYPSEQKLVNYGDSVDVTLTKVSDDL
jgi:serine/threonine-protein kinase